MPNYLNTYSSQDYTTFNNRSESYVTTTVTTPLWRSVVQAMNPPTTNRGYRDDDHVEESVGDEIGEF